MHVISFKRLRVFWRKHADAEVPLRGWYRVVRRVRWRSFAEVRATYRHADQVDRFTVFDIGGNKYRLIAVIHCNRQKLYVRHGLTHREYERGKWKEE